MKNVSTLAAALIATATLLGAASAHAASQGDEAYRRAVLGDTTVAVPAVANRTVLLPGSYAEVHFKLAANASALRLPDNTLLFRGSNIQVAAVDGNGHVELKTITLGRDFGKEVEVMSGVAAGDRIIVNPPDAIAAGDVVRPVEPAPEKAATGKDGAAK